MTDNVTCPSLGPDGIELYLVRGNDGISDDPSSFRIAVALDASLVLERSGTRLVLEPGTMLLVNPGRPLCDRPVPVEGTGRIFVISDPAFRRLAHSLTNGKTGAIRFFREIIRDGELAAMMADIHAQLLADPADRRAEALFVASAVALMRQYARIGGIPAASPLQAAPIDPSFGPDRPTLP